MSSVSGNTLDVISSKCGPMGQPVQAKLTEVCKIPNVTLADALVTDF